VVRQVYTYIERFEEGLADPGEGGEHDTKYITPTPFKRVTYHTHIYHALYAPYKRFIQRCVTHHNQLSHIRLV
jgi:hypothetical protein